MKMRNSHLDDKISKLELDFDIVHLLNENNILYIKDLWIKDRNSLKNMGFSDVEINKIKIKMQLYGIYLNKKVYSRDKV